MTSQAATSVFNCAPARTYEALVATSLVGVVVFDAKTGRPMTFNREARRIVESLCPPGDPPDQLPKAITLRRADGCEMSMNRLPVDATRREPANDNGAAPAELGVMLRAGIRW